MLGRGRAQSGRAIGRTVVGRELAVSAEFAAPRSTTDEAMSSDDAVQENAAAAPCTLSPLLFGSGQSAWLAILTVGVAIAIVLSATVLVMASDSGDGGDLTSSGPVTSFAIAGHFEAGMVGRQEAVLARHRFGRSRWASISGDKAGLALTSGVRVVESPSP